MADDPRVSQADLPCLARILGLDDSPAHLALVGPQILAFHAAVARLRELELGEAGPAAVYRLEEGEE